MRSIEAVFGFAICILRGMIERKGRRRKRGSAVLRLIAQFAR